ncbi:MAG: T9SS type A sorting domain-containing protein, partial [Bacteroidia bacterium]|nr:T9SS type A sorting domain-containing protein [Bacteroidia bacterium]
LKEILFIYSDEVLPILYIKLYRKKIVRQGDLISVVSRYSIEEITEVKDTTYIDIDSYKPILENKGSAAAFNTISFYPNPAKDFVILSVQSGLNSNYKISISDISGKVLNEILVNTPETKIDLSWESPGVYFVNLYDTEGQLIYGNKFIKL